MQEHETGGHAILSPSGSERWISCPASIRVAAALGERDEESVWAREGTAAHALAEMRAREALVLGAAEISDEEIESWRQEFSISEEQEAEMQGHADAYVALLRERLDRHPNSVLLLEQRVQTGVPSCWGTSDAIIVSPVHVEIVDYKYGQGVRVSAVRNSQLMLYGVGALEEYGLLLGEPELVYTTVHQPRLHHTDTDVFTTEELLSWRDGLLPIAEAALGDSAAFGPSDAACRWCPASGRCRAQRDAALAEDFGSEPDLLSPEELGVDLERLPLVKVWAAAVEARALHAIYSEGAVVPGWKVVMSGGRRVVADPEGLLDAAKQVGYTADDVAPRSLKGIGALEKLLGPDFDLMEQYIKKTEGKPSLAPDADRRPAVSPEEEAKKEFLL